MQYEYRVAVPSQETGNLVQVDFLIQGASTVSYSYGALSYFGFSYFGFRDESFLENFKAPMRAP